MYALVRIAITGDGWMDGWMNTDGSYLYSRYSQTQPIKKNTRLNKCGTHRKRSPSERSNSRGSSRQFVIVFSKYPLMTRPTKRDPDGKALTFFELFLHCQKVM